MPGYVEVVISSIGDLVADVMETYGADDVVWFRGQASAGWGLNPSLARKHALGQEKALRSQFQRDAVPLLTKASIPGGLKSDWDWMFLMQHYGVPTRLLDWSENALTGLYFAVNDPDPQPGSAALWALQPHELNKLSHLSGGEQWDLPFCGEPDGPAENYTTEQIDIGGAHRKLLPLAVIAERMFDRVVAQQGVFTVMHRDETKIEELGTGSHVRKYKIPEDKKLVISGELARIGITEISLFPDLQRLGARVAARVS